MEKRKGDGRLCVWRPGLMLLYCLGLRNDGLGHGSSHASGSPDILSRYIINNSVTVIDNVLISPPAETVSSATTDMLIGIFPMCYVGFCALETCRNNRNR
jgi:hypothetical protein